MSKIFFLHNKKVIRSKANENKVKETKRGINYAKGSVISKNEMVTVMISHAKSCADRNFIVIPEILL